MIDLESRANALFEVSLQGLVDSSRVLAVMTSWTYWLSQFTVLGSRSSGSTCAGTMSFHASGTS